MSQLSTSYTSEKLYEEAYNIQYNWDKILPLDVLEFHTLVSKQTNAPVDLQMGTILPFVASCMGPKNTWSFPYHSVLFEFILDCCCCIWCW